MVPVVVGYLAVGVAVLASWGQGSGRLVSETPSDPFAGLGMKILEPGDPGYVSPHVTSDSADLLKELTYALFRSNVDWAREARECGEPSCRGDCEYIATIRRIVREVDGGILAGPE